MKIRSPSDEAGFTVLALLLAVVIINIGMGVAATSLVTVDRRAKEAALIWRGRQYVRALQCHQRQTGALPEELDDLLDSNCIRALYPEPMSRDGQWRIIREGELDGAGQGTSGGAEGILDSLDRALARPGSLSGDPSGGRQSPGLGLGGASRQGSGQSGSLQEAMQRFETLSRSMSERLGSGSRIVGVASRSPKEALRLYGNESTYDAWRFVAEGSGG